VSDRAGTEPPAAVALAPSSAPPARRRSSAWRDLGLLSGVVIVGAMMVMAALANVLAPYGPNEMNFMRSLEAPSASHWFGTDELGRDMMSRLMFGARASLTVGIGTALLAALLGTTIGVFAGFFGGRLDAVLMRIMDVFFAFPAILLALTLVVVLGTNQRNIILALGVIYMPQFARVARAATLSVKGEAYIEAARAVGNGDGRLVARHLLPNIFSPIIVQATVTVAFAILAEAGLSFVGLGIQPPNPSWGAMLNTGKIYLEQLPHLTVFPGLFIMLAVLGFNLLGDGLRDLADPQARDKG
jgi:peptide/nickel transport system permease protein